MNLHISLNDLLLSRVHKLIILSNKKSVKLKNQFDTFSTRRELPLVYARYQINPCG